MKERTVFLLFIGIGGILYYYKYYPTKKESFFKSTEEAGMRTGVI